jgi:outer membrane protein assembly factor BamB
MACRTALRALLAVAVIAGAAGAADWPQLLGPTRDGHSTEKGLRGTFPREGPPVLWSREVGEGYSSPVIAGGKLFLLHRHGGDEVVECLDAATGKPAWKYGYACEYDDPFRKGNGPRATPVVAGDRVYTFGVTGVLTCLDRDKGTKVWQRELPRDYTCRPTFFGFGTSPLVEGDLVVVNLGAKGAGIVAFDRKTGKEVWKATDHETSYASPLAVTFAGVRHLLFFTREGLVSLDPANGQMRFSKRWRSRMNASVNAATPVVRDQEIFLSACYDTGAILLRGGKDSLEEIWKGDDALSCHFSTPVLVGDSLYGFDGRQEEGGRLRCIDWKTGKVRWSADGYGCGSLIAADGKLLVMSEGGDLVLVEPTPEACREKARAHVLTGPVRAHLALSDGRLYCRDNRKLVCWDLRSR